MSASLIPGFSHRMLDIDGGRMSVHVGGKGPPLLLLHGFPQTHLAWLRTAPGFADRFTCIIPDLPGYGESEMPRVDGLCAAPAMSKRVMAQQLARMMAALGHARFDVLGHDRGARVAYRMALDTPARVSRIGVIEVIPTADMWRAYDARLALRSWHWSFLAQPAPQPEAMIAAAPDVFLEWALSSWTVAGDLSTFPSSALDSYRAQLRNPACLRAMCDDYRAGAGIDRDHDEEDRAAGRTIKAPLHFVWTANGFPSRAADPVGLWRPWADTVTGAPSASGHFALEEHPDAVLDAFLPFFSAR
jgi:haloacetate dehalogenase